ncbi:DUF6889 family protein [Xanthobacter sp. ZOL 2024]
MDWLLQPVARGWCKYESLKDGTLDLCDIALINEAIASHDENSRRVQAAMKRGS